MRILIVTSCTGEKAVTHERALSCEDFAQGKAHVKRREKSLGKYLTPAQELYSGLQHQRLMRGVSALRENGSKADLDLRILSAGYGLVPATQKLAPYECTFAGMKKAELKSWAEQLQVPRQFREVVKESYDLGLVLLGDDYLRACDLDNQVQLGGPTLFLTGKASAARLPKMRGSRAVVLSNAEAKRFSCGLVGLKGEVTARLLETLVQNPQVMTELTDPATDILDLLDTESTPKVTRRKARANPSVDKVIQLPESWQNKSHRGKLRYFIPEWDDLVDPEYDFERDVHSGGSGDWSNEVYAHQMYPEPNYDGILVSKVVAEKSKKKKERINALGVHRFLRVPRQFPIMGDCGAFGYINEDVPPYSTDEILDYYTRLDFDLGVSVDHLIVSATEANKKERYQLTIQNAEDFLREHRKRSLPWTPIGAVQGWDPKSYANAAEQYIKMGYRYIALGGLVRTTTKEILQVLEQVHEVVPAEVDVHLFGLARLGALHDFSRLGVRSVDSASYLRQAWMRDSQGYLTEDGSYAALRIPEIGKSFRAKRMLAENGISEKKARVLELKALNTLRLYDAGKATLEDSIEALIEYERLFGEGRSKHAERYAETLAEKPWKRCDCNICRQDGVDVIIFRGNNRNRRRGFHNTYVFYRLLQKALNGEIVHIAGKGEAAGTKKQLQLFQGAEATGT